jgi:hypothetical protein
MILVAAMKRMTYGKIKKRVKYSHESGRRLPHQKEKSCGK